MLPGLTREAEEQKLQEIIGIAQQNLERARADIRKVNEDLEDLLDVYEAQDKEGLMTMNNIGKNMAWLLKCIAAGKESGIQIPENEKVRTNFIR